jgi:hypothetical protein
MAWQAPLRFRRPETLREIEAKPPTCESAFGEEVLAAASRRVMFSRSASSSASLDTFGRSGESATASKAAPTVCVEIASSEQAREVYAWTAGSRKRR